MTENEKYLEQIERDLYNSIQTRKTVQSWLFFGISQVGSASFALWLFQLGANLLAIYAIASFIAVLPGLLDCTGHIAVNSRREWEVSTPTPAAFKLVGGTTTAAIVNYQVWTRVSHTQAEINETYKDIRRDSPWVEMFNGGLAVAIVITILGLLVVGRVKK